MFVTGSMHGGGAERLAVALMNGLAGRGHQCHAVYVKRAGGTLKELGLQDGVSAHCLDAAGYFDMRAVDALAACIARTMPTVIVATNPYALMYATLARRGSLARLVVTYHETITHGVKDFVQMIAYRPLFWAADCAVFVCAEQRRHWRLRGVLSRRNEVIYNGIDADRFSNAYSAGETSELRRQLGFSEQDFVIGISAWLRPEKNHVQLVDAVSRLRRDGVPARALMIGDGDLRETVEARARSLQVGEHILITGARRDVRPYLAACNVMVLCSVAVETFSLAALEAMAMEKPVIHSDLGGAAEMILPGFNGFLFPVGDTAALVQHLTALRDVELARRMGANARAAVRERFAEDTMVDRYEALLLDLCRLEPGRSFGRARGAA